MAFFFSFASLGRRAAAAVGGAALLALAGCGSFQKDVDIPLPEHNSQLVVECYLEPGVVPSLTVTESVAYLTPVLQLPPSDVTVTLIMPDGRRVDLPSRLGRDPLTKKFFTHIGTVPLVAHPGETFGLEVADTRGRRVTGSATMPVTVPIDSVEYKFNDKSGNERRAYVITSFRDPATPDNYYRLQLHKRDSIYSAPEQDFLIEDRLNNGKIFPVGTSFRFYPGDTITSTLYHIDPAYYRFRRSTRDARNANGNPFAQPSAIASTVQGGIGVFTVLNYTRKRQVLPK